MKVPFPGDVIRLGKLHCYVTKVSVAPDGVVMVEYRNGSTSKGEYYFRWSDSII